MARSFNGVSDFLTLSSLPALTSAISISFNYNLAGSPGSVPNRYGIISAQDFDAHFINYYVYFDNTGITFIYTTASATYVNFSTTTSFDTGVDHKICISSDFTTAGTKIYLDGSSISFSTGGTASTPSTTVDTYLIGKLNTSGIDFLNGKLSEIAVWNVQLDAMEANTLSRGYSPLFVRPSRLTRYCPLVRNLNELKAATTTTATGTTVASHPRTIMPRGRRLQTKVGLVFVYMRPDADSSDGSWLNELGTNVDLYASVDETVASDTDYIQSSTTWGDKVRVRLSDPSAGVAQPLEIRYRASGVSAAATLTGRLYQGASTLIDSWSHTVDTTPTNYTHTLGSTEFALISDFTDLFIEFEYNP